MDLSLDILDQIAEVLVDEIDDVRSASVDPAKVTALPGVWLQFIDLDLDRLGVGCFTVNARLTLLVDDNGHRRSRAKLLAVASQVLDKVDAAGPVTPQPTVLPSSPKVLPGLVIPISLDITTQE